MPLIMNPLISSGGYVMGTLITPILFPASLRSFHKVRDLINVEFVNGRIGFTDTGALKSKRPCLPGFLPVMKEAHACALKGGMVDCKTPWTPFSIREDRLGRYPFFMRGSKTVKVAPSNPITRTFCRLCIEFSGTLGRFLTVVFFHRGSSFQQAHFFSC